MKKLILVFAVLFSFLLVSCGQDNSETTSQSATTSKSPEKKDEEITVERYVNYYKEADALLMEKYWPQFKGKSYSEAKDLYAQYKKEAKALFEKHNIENPKDLYSFFRRNFKDIEEFRKNDPDYTKHPEYDEARLQLSDYAIKEAAGK
jgi:hypothetical protein